MVSVKGGSNGYAQLRHFSDLGLEIEPIFPIGLGGLQHFDSGGFTKFECNACVEN